MTPERSDELDLTLDRDADVPIGVQLAWALRARIRGGALAPGQRLPALHRLAQDIGVNANTVRAVYRRLEQDGLVETRHGSGTFVTGTVDDRRTLTQLVAGAARAARDAGVDPREVAAALYVGGEDPVAPDAEAAARRRLRAQIAALEQALSELLARRPDLGPRIAAPSTPAPTPEPRLLSAAELERHRTTLLQRLVEVQTAVDAGAGEDPPAGPAAPRATAKARRAKLRAAPRAT